MKQGTGARELYSDGYELSFYLYYGHPMSDPETYNRTKQEIQVRQTESKVQGEGVFLLLMGLNK